MMWNMQKVEQKATATHAAATADVCSPLPNARNWTKMVTSSTMVPSEPINHGKLVKKYSFSKEWKRI
jgi:hypothetical protein